MMPLMKIKSHEAIVRHVGVSTRVLRKQISNNGASFG
jgi:hypothetical protein